MRELPVPAHFQPDRVGEVWRVDYEQRARDAASWAPEHDIRPASGDSPRICLKAVAEALGLDPDYAGRHLRHYTRALADGGKYNLTIWPYHAMLGGIGHALV